jgi:ADP-heptose:LPS heptosyltransferase
MAFARLAGVKWAGGWSLNTLRWAARSQSEQIEFPNEAERLLADVARCGVSVAGAAYKLPVSASLERKAADLLVEAGVGAGAKVVALAPGAKRPTNRWPAERFAAVGREMLRRGYSVVVLGSNEELGLAESVCAMVGAGCASLAGKTDIAAATWILRRCSLLVCNDSGLQHTASAAGTPCVAIFSARDLWGKWRPHHPGSTMLRKNVPCHTCFLEHCPNANLCLTEITTSEVIDVALATLEETVQVDGCRNS